MRPPPRMPSVPPYQLAWVPGDTEPCRPSPTLLSPFPGAGVGSGRPQLSVPSGLAAAEKSLLARVLSFPGSRPRAATHGQGEGPGMSAQSSRQAVQCCAASRRGTS